MTGSLPQACSTAGVSAAVVFGETMSASHFPLLTRSLTSAICFSSLLCASTTLKLAISGCSFASCSIVFRPTTRQGLPTPALETQRLYGPAFLYWLVSAVGESTLCSHGWSAGPSGVLPAVASWRSYSAWSNHLEERPSLVTSPSPDFADDDPSAEPQPARRSAATLASAAALMPCLMRVSPIDTNCRGAVNVSVWIHPLRRAR